MIQSHFDYCINVWGFITKKNIISSKLLCARAVSGQSGYTVSASSLIHNLGWMTMEERRFYSLFVSFVCLFVCLSVCLSVSPFSQPWFYTGTITLVSYPGMANHRSLPNFSLIRPS